MFKLHSKINPESQDFIRNSGEFLKVLASFREKLEHVQCSRAEFLTKKHKSRGKLLVRERIDLLLDTGTPFLELSPLAAFEQYDNQFPSAGIVTGIGLIHNRETVIIANDATVKGGTYIKETIKKHIRAQEIALQNHLACVYMVDSGGVFLPKQEEVFPDRFDFGRIFYNQAKLSAVGIPQISIVMGSCTAGGAYIPAMSDETIMVKNQGTIFIGGPPLVKAATGESVSPEELGGGEVHTSISGVADHLADNDIHALQICRNIFESLPRSERQTMDLQKPMDPLYKAEEIYGLIPPSLKQGFDAKELIARIIDGSEFHEFKENYGKTIITGFSRIMGIPVGIVANNGILFSESSLKATHFIELCNFRKIPIVFLQNIAGFIVGKDSEHKGIAKDGAKLVHSVATSNVPRITIIIGGSYGAGNYAMSGRAYDPNFLFMWPNARISVMGGEQAAEVLVSVRNDKGKEKEAEKEIAEEKNKQVDSEKPLLQGKGRVNEKIHQSEISELRDSILKKYEREGNALYSTSRIWDDGIIDPADTRKILGMTLSVCLNRKFPEPKTGIFRM